MLKTTNILLGGDARAAEGHDKRGALIAYVHLSSSQFLGLGSWYCSDCDLHADIGSDCAGCWESQPQASKVAKKKTSAPSKVYCC